MILNGFVGRTIRQVEREESLLRIDFEDGGYLYVRAQGPAGSWLRITCSGSRCDPAECVGCQGVEHGASE